MTSALPRSLPEAQGVDSDGIDDFLDAVEADPQIELHSLMILRHGHLIADGWWAPYSAQQPHLLYSLSKSFTSTAAAFAVAEGLLDLDARVLSYFPEYDEEVSSSRSRSMLVRHLLAMASGHADETWDTVVAELPRDPVLTFLQLPPDADPGTLFAYNQPCTYTLGAIIQRESGQTLTEYLRPRLFDPLGIDEAGWQSYAGVELGFVGLHVTTGAIARLGQLYLQQGRWNGEQLISADWVAEATSKQISTEQKENPDWQQGYGFQFWMATHGYRGDGAYGQFCIVLPEQDAVIAITAATSDMQAILTAVWDHLLPAFGEDRSPSPEAGYLISRLGNLTLPPLTADGAAPGWPASAAFVPARTDQPTITAVELVVEDRGPVLSLIEGEARMETAVGLGRWATNAAAADHGHSGVPLAASGGWLDADTFAADVIFLQTPHRLAVRTHLASGSFEARWLTVPLKSGELAELRMPRESAAS